MGNASSIPQNSSPLVVNWDGKSAIISRHIQYEVAIVNLHVRSVDIYPQDAVAAVKAVRTFKESLSHHEIYFTAYLPQIGEEEFELSEDAWGKVLESITTLNVHVVGQDGAPFFQPLAVGGDLTLDR